MRKRLEAAELQNKRESERRRLEEEERLEKREAEVLSHVLTDIHYTNEAQP